MWVFLEQTKYTMNENPISHIESYYDPKIIPQTHVEKLYFAERMNNMQWRASTLLMFSIGLPEISPVVFLFSA